MGKSVFLLLFVFGVCFLFVSEGVLVQAQVKPDVPEFTLELVDASFYLFPGPAQNMDPDTGTYTDEGKTQTFQAKYIDNWRIDVIIKNEKDIVMYNIRFKADFEQEWTEMRKLNLPNSGMPYRRITLKDNAYPDGTLFEVQVEAMLGAISRVSDEPVMNSDNLRFDGVTSGWSNSQTMIINRSSEGLTDQPLYDSGFSWIELCLLVIVVVTLIGSVVTLTILKKRNKQKNR